METGVLGEFEDPEALIRAIHELKRRGWQRMDAFTPYPVKGLDEALGLPRSTLNWRVLPFAILGAAGGYFIQWFCNAYDYPLNVGGRPPHSAPAFIPITFEMGVLAAAIFGVLIGFYLTELPRLYLPLFDAPGFTRATLDRFLVGIDAADPSFTRVQAESDLRELGAARVIVATRREEP
ncbi:ABC-type Fe3+ transport system protein [Minicystis rosea]|nr:ABC-type Fe3+ transport system protein [Minicystis rosea]